MEETGEATTAAAEREGRGGRRPMESSAAREGGGSPRRRGGRVEKLRTPLHFLNPLLRLLQLASTISAFVVMINSNHGGVRFEDFQAFSYLVAGTVIATFWALLMSMADWLLCLSSRTLHSPTYMNTVLLGDFVALALSLSAGAAAGAITTQNDQGVRGRPFICTGSTPFNSFCARTKAATAMAVIAAVFFLPSLALDMITLAHEFYEVEVPESY